MKDATDASDAQDVNEGSFVLVQAYRRQQALLAAPEPAPSAWWIAMEIAEQRAHGFLYKPTEWFGPVLPERIVKRLRRAIDRLEADGLLVLWRKYGGRMTHLKLTPAGERLAVELLARHGGDAVEGVDQNTPPQTAAG
ncbi:MAG: hypothetical protein C0485_04310 [Pirellula sp.]|nr:hypothetical protein [Pirellula sp.]